MERINRKAVDEIAGHVSSLLPKGTFVLPVEQNGHCVLDLCYLEVGGTNRETVVRTERTLRAGTKREMYEYLLAMREGILLSREPEPFDRDAAITKALGIGPGETLRIEL